MTRRLVLGLFAGRGAFRAVTQLAPLALAATWGRAGFNGYATAVGLCAWAMFVAASGEKAALKLLPRARRLGPDLERVLLRLGAAPLVAVAVAAPAAALLPVGADARLIVTAAGYAAGLGLLQLVVALHRLRGRASHDAAAYAMLAALAVAATATAATLRWSPQTYLLTMVAATLAVLAVVAVPLRRAHDSRGRRRVARPVLRTAVLLGVSDLAGSLGVAVCYLALDLTGHRAGSGLFYLAAVASGFCSAAVLYLLRLVQPATSLRQRGPAGAGTRAAVRRLLGPGVVVATATLAALPVAAGLDPALLVAALTVVEIPLFAVVTYAGFRLENTDGRTPVATATAAVAGLGGVAVAAALLTGPLGAAGAMAALVAGLGVTAATTLYAVRDRDRRKRRRYARLVRSSFATVPRYREQWFRTGTPLTADPPPIPPADVVTRREDLFPLGGHPRPRAASGRVRLGAFSGLSLGASGRVRRGASDGIRLGASGGVGEGASDGVGVGASGRLPSGAPLGPDPRRPSIRSGADHASPGARRLTRRNRSDSPAHRPPTEYLADPVLGPVARRRRCGHWHLERGIHARTTNAGTAAFTVLDRRVPRLVDIGTDLSIGTCPAHGVTVVNR